MTPLAGPDAEFEITSDNPVVRRPLPHVVSGPMRILFVSAGLVFVGIAYVGIVMPGLPATPWLLLASYCFARSSPRLQRWLFRSPVFGTILHDWHHHRGMRPRVKAVACTMVTLACTISITTAPIPDWVRVAIGCSGVIGILVILFIAPTVRVASPSKSTTLP